MMDDGCAAFVTVERRRIAALVSSTSFCNSAGTASPPSSRDPRPASPSSTLDFRLKTLDSGLRTLDSVLKTLDSGLWILDSGLRTLDFRLKTLDSFSTRVYRRLTTSATDAKSSCPSTVLILNRR